MRLRCVWSGWRCCRRQRTARSTKVVGSRGRRGTPWPVAAAEEGEAAGEAGYIGLADGVDVDDAVGRLPPSWEVLPPPASNDLNNLRQVRSLPIYLAAFLAFLAVGAVAHALFTSARQRARELAVLRALGLTARQIAVCVSWQALVIGAFAAVVGVPLGVIAGRRVWRGITEELSFVYVGPLAKAVVVVAAGVCLISCALARRSFRPAPRRAATSPTRCARSSRCHSRGSSTPSISTMCSYTAHMPLS